MGKKLRDEDLVLNIIVNGDKGKKEIGELERTINSTNRSINRLKKDQEALRKEGKQDTEQFKTLTAAIKEKEKAVRLAEERISQLRRTMKLTEMSMTDLRKEHARLTRLFNSASPGTENYRQLEQQVNAVGARIAELRPQAQSAGFSIGQLANRFNQYFTMITAGFVTIIAFFSGIKKINTLWAEFDDKVADVMKTTGLYKEEVRELSTNLEKIDTRTQQEDLLGLARVAGKLGITGKDDIEGFVKATDQLNVALSEDLGGDVEDTINQVGKLVDIFKVKEEFGIERGILKVGSTINSLGAASTANEGYLVEFAKRVAGVAPSAKISIQNILGLAATLDQFGQSAEVAATTFNSVIPAMFKDTASFARVAKMDIGAFTNLLNTDANAALLKVLEGLKGNNGEMSEMVARLGDLGIDATRATSVLGVLANNTKTLREQQALASQEFEKGTSITDEFNVKNTTAAAQLEKAKKQMYLMTVELGEKLFPVVTVSVNGFTSFVKILTVLAGFLIDNRKLIVMTTAALVGYHAAVMLSNVLTGESIVIKKAELIWSKLQVFWTNAQAGALHLLSAAYALTKGNIAAARAEMVLFNTVTKLNPIGVLVAVLAAATVGLLAFGKQVSVTAEAHKRLAEVEGDALKAIVQQKFELQKLLVIARDKTRSDNERISAIKKLNELSPEHLGFLNLENINTEKATAATEKYATSLLKLSRVKAAEQALMEIDKEEIDFQTKNSKEDLSKSQWLSLQNPFESIVEKDKKYKAIIKKNNDDFTKGLEARRMIIRRFLDSNTIKNAAPSATENGDDTTEILTSDQIKARDKYLRESKSALEQEKIAHDDRLREVGLFGKKRSDLTAKDLEVLKSLEIIHHKNIKEIGEKAAKQKDPEAEKRKQLLEQQREYQLEVIKSQKDLLEQENLSHQERLKKAGLAGKKREFLTHQERQALEALEKTHQDNINKIDSDAIRKNLDQKQKAFEKELAQMRIKNSLEYSSADSFRKAKGLLVDNLSKDELSKITTLEEAKKALKQKYQDEENEFVREHLNGLIAELETAVNNGELEGINLSDKVFSEEELEVLAERIGIAKEKLADLLSGLKSEGTTANKPEEFSFSKGKTDVFGLTQDDWSLLYENLASGKVGIQEMAAAAEALISIWSSYNQFVSLGEQRQLQEFEQSTNSKKEALKKRLDSGRISQARYSKEIETLDIALDKKKADLQYKQAKREKAIQVMSAITGTAAAVVGALGAKPWTPANFALAAIVGAAGAVQLGTILATPLPSVEGREEGGSLIDVRRSQDGKKFRAKYDPGKRGFISQPTVITGEAGDEFVVNHDAVNNPTVKPLLDLIDTAQKNGTISSLNLEGVMLQSSIRRVPGREKGGYLQDQYARVAHSTGTDPLLLEILEKNLEATNALNQQLSNPIKAQVALLGPDGFIAKQKELQDTQDGATL